MPYHLILTEAAAELKAYDSALDAELSAVGTVNKKCGLSATIILVKLIAIS